MPNLKRMTRDAIRGLGLDVRPVRRLSPGYAPIAPYATYSPWTTDEAFRRIHERVTDHTLVDVYRCWELWSLVREVQHLPGAIVEIGVWRGGTGAILARRAADLGIPDAVYLCDTFTGVAKAGSRDSHYRGGEHANTSVATVEELLRSLGLANARVVPGIFPDDHRELFEAARFRLAHIDVDVYQSAKDCFEFVWPRLSVGGVVVFDDYGFHGLDGVVTCVEEIRAATDRVTLYNLNGHAVVIKVR